jgi:hypothetical protein
MVGAEGEAMELGPAEEAAVGAAGEPAEAAAAAAAAAAAMAPATQPRVYQLELLELAKKRNVRRLCCLAACRCLCGRDVCWAW